MPLSGKQLRAVTWVEYFFRKFKRLPTEEEIPEDHDGHVDFTNEIFCKALSNRGIVVDRNRYLSDEDWSPTPEQMAALSVISDFNDKRSIRSKLSDMGIALSTYQGWLKDRHFKEFLHEQSSEAFEDSLPLMQGGLLSAVEKGNTDAIRMWLQMTGREAEINPQLNNIKLVIARLVESIQFHVKDPAIITRIAGDFDMILEGRQPDYKALDNVRLGEML